MKEELERLIKEYKTEKSKISVLVKELNGETIFELNSKLKANSASCIKTAIMVAVLEKVMNKELKLDEQIDFKDFILKDYDGIYTEKERHAILLELLTFMIIESDNFATDILINLYGFNYYNEYFRKIGLNNTQLNRLMGIYDLNIENYTSNEDMYKLYKMIINEEVLSKELCELAKSILCRQRDKEFSQRYIYEDIKVYHKTGELSWLNIGNDCGYFIINNCIYYFGFFMEQVKYYDVLIGKLFRIVYNKLKNKD